MFGLTWLWMDVEDHANLVAGLKEVRSGEGWSALTWKGLEGWERKHEHELCKPCSFRVTVTLCLLLGSTKQQEVSWVLAISISAGFVPQYGLGRFPEIQWFALADASEQDGCWHRWMWHKKKQMQEVNPLMSHGSWEQLLDMGSEHSNKWRFFCSLPWKVRKTGLWLFCCLKHNVLWGHFPPVPISLCFLGSLCHSKLQKEMEL